MVRVLIISTFLSLWLGAAQVRVAAAANMSYVMKSLIKAFVTTHPDASIEAIIGSSGKLKAQITHGAPFDLFLSANMTYPQALHQEGVGVVPPVVYAQGVLALFSSVPRDFSKGLAILEDPKVQKIAIANPVTAPYGTAAKEALERAGLYKKLQPKFVFGESVSQTVTYALRAADMGVIALSALYAPQMQRYKEGVHWVAVDTRLYTPIDQGMLLLRHAKGNETAKAFYTFIQSEEARKILQAFGYKVP